MSNLKNITMLEDIHDAISGTGKFAGIVRAITGDRIFVYPDFFFGLCDNFTGEVIAGVAMGALSFRGEHNDIKIATSFSTGTAFGLKKMSDEELFKILEMQDFIGSIPWASYVSADEIRIDSEVFFDLFDKYEIEDHERYIEHKKQYGNVVVTTVT